MEYNKEILGKRIKIRRKELGLNAIDIAKKVGIDKSTISKIESGMSAPSFETLILIAYALDCVPAYLLGDYDEPNPQITVELGEPLKMKTLKWDNFSLSFPIGDKKLTDKQKQKIAKIVEAAVMNELE